MFSFIRTLVFTNSELCNLQCKYCFITKNPTDKKYYLEAMRKSIVDSTFIKELLSNALTDYINVNDCDAVDKEKEKLQKKQKTNNFTKEGVI